VSTGWYGKQGDPTRREIYALLDPDTEQPRYVGCAQSAATRLTTHWQQKGRRTSRLAAWLRTLTEIPKLQVIESVPVAQWRDRERYWIQVLNGGQLLNVVHTPVASEVYGHAQTEETRQILREAMRMRHQNGLMPVARGVDAGKSALTEDDVRAIRADSRPQRSIAASYGISQPAVWQIKKRRTWTHVE
jgi:hypothetical protein